MEIKFIFKKLLTIVIIFSLISSLLLSVDADTLYVDNNKENFENPDFQTNDDYQIVESFDFKIREYPDGSWQDTPLVADVGTIVEFKIEIELKASAGYLSTGIVLPLDGDNPMFNYIQSSGSPSPNDDVKLVDFGANNSFVSWTWVALGSSWSETMTFRAEIVEETSGYVQAGAVATKLLPPTTDLVEDQFIMVDSEGNNYPILSHSPQNWDFGNVAKGETKTKTFDIWNAGAGFLSYSFSESCNWVSISPSSGSSTGEYDTITIEIDTSFLSEGQEYSCDIQITSNGGNGIFTVEVYVTGGASGPELSFSPSFYDFGNVVKGDLRATNFDIWNSGQDTLTYSFSESYDWLAINPSSGSSTGEFDSISVEIDTSSLSIGQNYFADIQIDSNGGDGVFSIILDVVGDQPVLYFTPESYDFGNLNEGTTEQTSFQIYNYGTQTLTYSLDWECPWINSVEPGSGSLEPQEYNTIAIEIDTTGLQTDQSYSCDIQINSNDRNDVFTLELAIGNPSDALLRVAPDILDFGTMQAGVSSTKKFELNNDGGSSISYVLSENSKWITSINPSSGTLGPGGSKGAMVTINTEGLTPGPHSASIIISLDSASSVKSMLYNVVVNIVDGDVPEASIDVDKKVLNPITKQWTDTINAYTGDILNFKCEIYNPNEVYRIYYIRAGDILPDNLEYIKDSIIVQTDLKYDIDFNDIVITYYFEEPLLPGETITIKYSLKAVQPGEIENIFKAQGMIDRITSKIDYETRDEIEAERKDPVEISIHDVFVSGAAKVRINIQDERPTSINPYDPYPTIGSNDVSVNSILSWKSDSDFVTLTYYDVILEKNNQNPTKIIAKDLTSKSYDYGDLEPNNHYYWKVIAKNNAGTYESPVWDFWTSSESGNDEMSISYPYAGAFQFFNSVKNSTILSFLQMSLIINSSLYVEAQATTEVHKVQFIASKANSQIVQWDNSSPDGFNSNFDLSFGIYQITANAYDSEENLISSDSTGKVVFLSL